MLGNQQDRTKGMKKQAQELIDNAYQRGFKAGIEYGRTLDDFAIEESIKQGRNEAWKAAREIAVKHTVPFEGWDLLRSGQSTLDVFNKYTAYEAISKIREYEEKQKEKLEHIKNFCENNLCSDCVLNGSDFKCGRGFTWDPDGHACGDIDKAYNLIKEYEEKQKKQDDEIKVGDEVYLVDNNHPRVVTCIFTENGGYTEAVQITESGRWIVDEIRNLHKTGRHFPEIAEVLAKMKEEETE